jgi:uncharacterized protein involved in outer membrane biogenesis
MGRNPATLLKNVLAVAGLLLALVLLASGAFVWWLRSDAVRQTIVTQASAAFGMPVQIDTARAAVFPRLGVELLNVTVGDPSRLRLDRVSFATGFRVIWTRRVEDADIQLTGGSLDASLLAALAGRLADTPAAKTPADTLGPLAIVSIRSIRLRDVTLSAGGERFPISVDASLQDDQLRLTNGVASVRDAAVQFDGAVTPRPFRLTADITAPDAMIGGHRAESLKARLNATPTAIVLDSITFELAGGHVQARASFDISRPNAPVNYRGRVSGIDVTRLGAAHGGQQKTVTGRLGATFAVDAPIDADSSALLENARGSIALDIRDGRMPGIEVVRQAVLRFANRADQAPRVDASDAFSELTASLALQSGAARLAQLTMKAEDFDITGNGTLSLVNWRIALDVDVTLTEALSQQAGRDLYRYARDGRRIVLPAIIGGTLFEPTATVDVGRAAGRALKNKAQEEIESFLERALKRPPREH